MSERLCKSKMAMRHCKSIIENKKSIQLCNAYCRLSGRIGSVQTKRVTNLNTAPEFEMAQTEMC